MFRGHHDLVIFCLYILPLGKQPAQRFDDLDRTLNIARESLETPKPKIPKLPVYRKSKLRDVELSGKIDDMTKRRRIVRIYAICEIMPKSSGLANG